MTKKTIQQLLSTRRDELLQIMGRGCGDINVEGDCRESARCETSLEGGGSCPIAAKIELLDQLIKESESWTRENKD